MTREMSRCYEGQLQPKEGDALEDFFEETIENSLWSKEQEQAEIV